MIKLETFDKSDYFRLINWIDSAETLLQFAGPAFSFPLTAEQLHKSCQDPDRKCFKVILTSPGQVIGHCEVYLIDHTGWLGRILIGATSLRGRGIGEHIVKVLIALCFGLYNCEVVKLNVFNRNESAIRCYERCGFTNVPGNEFQRSIGGQLWPGRQMLLPKYVWIQMTAAQ